ncbi:MAG: hypothetical protein V4585_22595 [Bacteroidota bacterium]
MITSILNIISLTLVFSQLLLVILYTLGILFYKYNKSTSEGLNENISSLSTDESVEYYSEEEIIETSKKDSDFENYDDYSAFTKAKDNVIIDTKSTNEIEENEHTDAEQKLNLTESETSTEFIEDSDEDYVLQDTIPTARVEEEDFEQISFDLPVEQDNSITMVTEEDIRRVFQKQESNDWVVRYQKTNP